MMYTSVGKLKARLPAGFEPRLEPLYESMIEDASAYAAFYGAAWPEDAVPPLVETIVLQACVQYCKLWEGVITSRAADETLQWTDLKELTGRIIIPDEDQGVLRELANGPSSGIASVRMVGDVIESAGSRPGWGSARPYRDDWGQPQWFADGRP